MFQNILVAAYMLIFLTFLVSFLHAYVSVKLTGPNQKWAKGYTSNALSGCTGEFKIDKK